MITHDQIAAWAAAGESETLEFKRTTGQRREAVRTLCAMLNHRGGRVLFGVEPDGRVAGQQVGEHTLEEVARETRRSIDSARIAVRARSPRNPYLSRRGYHSASGARRSRDTQSTWTGYFGGSRAGSAMEDLANQVIGLLRPIPAYSWPISIPSRGL